MKVPAFLAAVAVMLLAGSVLHAVQRMEQQTFRVPDGSTVKIDTYRGLINVVPEGSGEVRVVAHMAMETEKTDWAQGILDGFEMKAELVGNEVRITARNPRDGGVRFSWNDAARPAIEFTLHVPENINLELLTKDGGITVGNMRGNVHARGDLGTIFLRQIDGNVDAFTPTGDIIVSRCTGSVNLRASQGSVRIGTVGGRAVLETVNGDIEVQTAHNEVKAITSAGDVTAGFASFAGDSEIRTSVGNITAKVNPAEGFSLHAFSSWGKVTTDLPLAIERGGSNRSKLLGQYKGGGPLLELKASGGHVKIQPEEPLFPL